MRPQVDDHFLARSIDEYRALLRECAKLAGLENVELRTETDEPLSFASLDWVARRRLLADLRCYLEAAGGELPNADDSTRDRCRR